MAIPKKAAANGKAAPGAAYDETNRVVIFRELEANEVNRKPNFTGKVNVEGTDYRISLWSKTSKNGLKFLSGSIELATGGATKGKPAAPVEEQEDIPF
jgi:hypothetical protein